MTGIVGSINSKSKILGRLPTGQTVQTVHNLDNTANGYRANPGAGGDTPQNTFNGRCHCDITIKSATSKLIICASPNLRHGSNTFNIVYLYYKESAGYADNSDSASCGNNNDTGPATIGTGGDQYTRMSSIVHPNLMYAQLTGDPREAGGNHILQEEWTHGKAVGTTMNICVAMNITGNISSTGFNVATGYPSGVSGKSAMTIFEIES
jgi:hypothetical protein